LDELIVERLAWVEATLAQAGIQPRVEVPAGLVLQADRDRIGQLLSILIDNVARYASAGGAIDISASSLGDCIELVVADRGSGVSAADLPRLRDRFWRAEQSRNRNSGGTGLGLAIADAICQAHGGSLNFELGRDAGLHAIVRLVAAHR